MQMIEQICAEINNYFVHAIYTGEYTISGGALALPFLVPGQYFCISGSRLNDGVYQYPADELNDEAFDGEVWEMRPPAAFLAKADEIGQWQTRNAAALASPFQSESFADYSYSLKSGGSAGNNGGAINWQSQFADDLRRWRFISVSASMARVPRYAYREE